MKKAMETMCAYHGIVARALFGFAALAGTAALAEVTLDAATVAGDSVQSLHGGSFRINIEVSEDIIAANVTAGSPYIELKGISNFASPTAAHKATFAGFNGRELYFDYIIQAGDYSSGVDTTGSLNLNGAVITATHTGGATENLSDGMELPSFAAEGYSIRISTFYFVLEGADGASIFTNRLVVPDSRAKAGVAFSQTLYAGGTLSGEVRFMVSVICEDFVTVDIRQNNLDASPTTVSSEDSPCYVTLPADGAMTLIVTPQTTKNKEIRIRVRPANADGDNGADLYIVYPSGVKENEASIERISAVVQNGVYGYGESIRIMVEFSDDIRSVTSSSSSQPMLVLNVNNQNNDSANTSANTFKDFAAYDTTRPFKNNKMYFLYTVKAGDYVKDLDVSYVQNFFGNSISFDSGADFDGDVPRGSNSRSLASNSDIGIQTIVFANSASATANITMREDDTFNLVVTRGSSATRVQNFSITSYDENGATLRNGDVIRWPSTQGFSIPAGSDQATLTIAAKWAGTQILRLHPQGYDGTDGDLVATFTVTPGSTAPSVRLSGPSSVNEGAGLFVVNVSLSRTPKEDVVVEVKSSNHECLAITGTSSGTMRHDSTYGDYARITFPAYSTNAVALTVNPLDGLANGANMVSLTATHITNRTTRAVYNTSAHSVRVVNQPPSVTVSPTDEDGNWLVTDFVAMYESVLTWVVSDPSGPDLRNGISADIDFGDGTSTNVMCSAYGAGMVRHTYTHANGNAEKLYGGYTVRLTLRDKDGGQFMVQGRVIVSLPWIELYGAGGTWTDSYGEVVDSEVIYRVIGGKMEELPIPKRRGYAFKGWQTRYGEPIYASTIVEERHCFWQGGLWATWSENIIPTIEDIIETAINYAGFADAEAVKEAIGGDTSKYADFRAWAQGVPGGEYAVVASTNAAVSWLLGAEALFENEPAITITGLSFDDAGEATSSLNVTVEVKDGEDVVKVAAEKVSSMFEATSDLRDWDGAAKLTPRVDVIGTATDGSMTFTVTPGDGAAANAFLRIKVK